jgi:hypothetical protein
MNGKCINWTIHLIHLFVSFLPARKPNYASCFSSSECSYPLSLTYNRSRCYLRSEGTEVIILRYNMYSSNNMLLCGRRFCNILYFYWNTKCFVTDKYGFHKILAEFLRNLKNVKFYIPIPVAVQCKAYLSCRSLVGIAGSVPAEVILFCVLYVIS